MPVIIFTTGEPGSGKTYCRAAKFLADEYLPEKSGVHCSNFPVNIPEMAEFVASRTGQDQLELEERMERIPPEEIELWARESRNKENKEPPGPWTYFEDRDLDRMHIAFDECHEFISCESTATCRQKWREWLAQIRHQGATVEFISQNPQQVANEVRRLASLQIELKNASEEKEPIFGIRHRFWQELQAGFISGKYYQVVRESVLHKARGHANKWIVKESRVTALVPKYFGLYDSYSAPKEGAKVGRGEMQEFEKRGRLSLLLWFISHNAYPLGKRVFWIAIIGGFFALGGPNYFMQKSISIATSGQFTKGVEKVKTETDPMYGLRNGPSITKASVPVFTPPPGVSPEQAEEMQNQTAAFMQGCCDELAKLKAEMQQVKDEHEQELELVLDELNIAEQELQKVFEITLITENEITFRNGYSYMVGEVIDAGTYRGKTVESINWRRRQVHLDDGTSLRMGYSAPEPGAGDPGGVPGQPDPVEPGRVQQQR